jgi:hypothetical protein
MKITEAMRARSRLGGKAHGDAMIATTKERFWARVDVSSNKDVCWEWNRKGWFLKAAKFYPMLSCRALKRNGPVQAHRVAFWLHYGYNPETGHVCHRCGNHLCCNPHHLYHGTAKSNYADTVAHGKFKPLVRKVGEQVHNAKLTADQVRLIQKVYPTLKKHEKALFAKTLGIVRAHAYVISKGGAWGHVHPV